MKLILLCIILFLVSIVFENCDAGGGSGGVIANIGAYITLYKHKKKQREEALKNKKKKEKKVVTTPANRNRYRYDDSYTFSRPFPYFF